MTDEAIKNEVVNDDADDRPGLRLKKAREALNLSLEDIAKHLKSNRKIIDALENEDFENLPQTIYVSGYLRSYANLVSLPVDDILQSYPNLTNADPVIPKFRASVSGNKFITSSVNKQKKSSPKMLVLFLFLVTGIALAGWVYLKSNGFTEYVSQVITNKVIVGDTAESASARPEPQFLEKPQFLKKPQFEEKPPVEEVQAPAPEKEVEVIETGSSKLLLEFTMDSWVEVTDAGGKRLVYRLAKAQSRRTVEGEAPFKVFLGNAPGVTVNYNGLPFDLGPHRNGDVAQLTIGKAEDNVKQVNQE